MGTALVKIPQMATQNLDLDNTGKPKLKTGSPVARVKRKGQQVVATIPSPFAKAHKPMTDARLEHRKRAAATSTAVTSTLSLGALGAAGAGEAATRLGSLKKVPKMVQHGKNLTKGALPVSLLSGGIAGVSGYNSAAIQREEARRRSIGKAAGLSKAYDSERNRFRRNRVEEPISFAAGGVALGGAGYLGHRAATRETADVRTGRANLGRAKASASKTEAGFSAAQIARESSEKDVKRSKHTLTRMEKPPDATKTYTPEQVNRRLANLTAQQKLVAAHEKAHFEAGANEKKLKDLIPKKNASANKAAQGLKSLRRVRRISATKAGALGVLGAGGVAGGMYLHRVPNSKSGQSYSKRYRPGQT